MATDIRQLMAERIDRFDVEEMSTDDLIDELMLRADSLTHEQWQAIADIWGMGL